MFISLKLIGVDKGTTGYYVGKTHFDFGMVGW
jgi:hypothetical protein